MTLVAGKSFLIAVTLAASCAGSAVAAGLDLSRYRVAATYGLDVLGPAPGNVSGLEASAVTWAGDRLDDLGRRGTLFFVGDEGTGVIEISRTGKALGAMAFNWSGTGSTNNDAEGLTYLGGGVLVVAEERLQNLYRFSYTAGGTAAFGTTPYASIGPTIGNVGIEGVSFDPRNGGFVTVKQDNPAQLRMFDALSFSAQSQPDATPTTLFSGASALFGLASLSDVQTLAPVQSLAGTPAADHLLVLSLESRVLIEVDRSGQEKSRFNLAGILPANAIEGVTVAPDGTIYLVAEHDQSGLLPFGVEAKSQLIVLTPVPEPHTYAMLLAGLAVTACGLRRRDRRRR